MNTKKLYVEIGEIVEIEGFLVECCKYEDEDEDYTPCAKCFFYELDECLFVVACHRYDRKDDTRVYFKKVK